MRAAVSLHFYPGSFVDSIMVRMKRGTDYVHYFRMFEDPNYRSKRFVDTPPSFAEGGLSKTLLSFRDHRPSWPVLLFLLLPLAICA